MITKEVIELAAEIRNILSQTKGAKNVAENFSLAYLLLVENDEDIEGAKAVAEMLSSQAQAKFSLDIDIIVTTQAELDAAREETEKAVATFDIAN